MNGVYVRSQRGEEEVMRTDISKAAHVEGESE